MTTHSTGSGAIQGCGCEYCGATGAHNGFIVVASYAEPEPLALIWTKSVEYEKKSDGAVGSTEAPPNPWTGISGPVGALDLIWNSALPEISDAEWRLWNSAKCAEIESLTFERDSAVEFIKTQDTRIAASKPATRR